MVLLTLLLCTVFSHLYWQQNQLSELLSSTRQQVFSQHQWWRLFTAPWVHGDLQHLLSNSYMLAFMVFFVHGYFGFWIYPVMSFFAAAVIQILALWTYEEQVRLVGASGLVYFLAGFWLSMYFLIERQKTLLSRFLRTVGVGLAVLFPTTFDPQVSYRAHGLGFILGVLLAGAYFLIKKKKIRSAEVKVKIPSEDETSGLDGGVDGQVGQGPQN